MFFKTHKTATSPRPGREASRALAAGLDIAIDFATLGEYRLVSDAVGDRDALHADGSATDRDMWAAGIEWSSAPERTRAACSLPRARNRDWARSRISG